MKPEASIVITHLVISRYPDLESQMNVYISIKSAKPTHLLERQMTKIENPMNTLNKSP